MAPPASSAAVYRAGLRECLVLAELQAARARRNARLAAEALRAAEALVAELRAAVEREA